MVTVRGRLRSELRAMSHAHGTWRIAQKPFGAVAQLGERLLCKQEVTSSILVGSTTWELRIANLESRIWVSNLQPVGARSSAG